MSKGTYRGVLLAFISGCCWATLGIVGKILSDETTNMLSVGMVRLVVLLGGSFIYFALFDRQALRVPRGRLLFLWLSGTVTVFSIYVGFFMSLNYISVPMAIALLYTHPLWTTLTSGLFLRERPSRVQIFSSLLVVVGAVIVIGPAGVFSGSFSVKGVLWVLMSAVGMALYSLFGRLSSRGEGMDQGTFFFYFHLMGFLSMSFINVFTGGFTDLMAFSALQWKAAFFMGFVGTLVGYSLYFVALRYISASLGSAVATVELVVTIVFAALLLDQIPTTGEIVGSLVITASILTGVFGERRSVAMSQ